MKNIKKSLMVLLILLFTISVIGCSTGGKDGNTSEGSEVPSGNNSEQDNVDEGDSEDENVSGEGNILDKIKANNKIIWGTNAAFAPFEMREGNDVIGIDAEIAQKIADKLGVELVVEDMEFDSLIAALQSGKIDFIAAGFTIKPDRQEKVLFTDTYFKAVQAVLVQDGNPDIKSYKDLEGKKIGVQIDTTGFYEAEEIEGAEVIQYNNGIEAVLDLSNGNIDAVIIDNLPAQILVESNPDLVILEFEDKPFEDEEYAMAVRKEDTELQKVINEVLKELKDSGEIEALVNKYSIGEQ